MFGRARLFALYRDSSGLTLNQDVFILSPMRMVIFLLLFVSCGCEPAPAEVYEAARSAADEKKWEEVKSYFDQESRAVFEGLELVSKATSRKLSYPVRIQNIHSWSEIHSEKIEGNRALLEVGKKRFPEKVVFVVEEGSWKIRGLSMEKFWAMP